MLGRDMLGFDKRMANFFTTRNGRPARLLPDGRLANGGLLSDLPVPLGEVTNIDLVDTTGGSKGLRLMDLDCASPNHTDPDALEWLNLASAFGLSLLAA